MLAAEHQVHLIKFFLDIAMKFHGSCANRKQYLSINVASYLASATFLPVTELKSFYFSTVPESKRTRGRRRNSTRKNPGFRSFRSE